ncbi:MAG: PAS domain-containing protein [Chloroflexota bacterium]
MHWRSADMLVATPDEPQQLLALLEAQVGSLVELLPVGLMVTSASGVILRINSPAAALLGSAADLVGQSINIVLRESDVTVRTRVLRHRSEVIRLYVVEPIIRMGRAR